MYFSSHYAYKLPLMSYLGTRLRVYIHNLEERFKLQVRKNTISLDLQHIVGQCWLSNPNKDMDFIPIFSLLSQCLLHPKICPAMKVKESEVAQWCPTLCDPMDCSLSGSSVHGIFQARVLEWIAVSFSRGSS